MHCIICDRYTIGKQVIEKTEGRYYSYTVRRYRLIAVYAALLTLCARGLYAADEIRIGLFIPALSEQSGTDHTSLVDVLNQTLAYYIETSESCAAVRFDRSIDDTSETALSKTATDFDLDSIIFIDSTTEPTIILFSPDTETTTVYEIEKPLLADGQYDSAHLLLNSFLNGLLETSTTWGNIKLNPRGADGTYFVEVDGVFTGRNLRLAFAVPAGSHVVRVTQNRPFGEQILLEERITLSPGDKKSVSFLVPELTDLERTAFEAIDRKILSAWQTDEKAVREQFSILESLFDGIQASSTVEKYKEKYNTWKNEYTTGQTASKISIEAPAETAEREEIAAQIEKDIDLSAITIQQEIASANQPAPGIGSVFLASFGPLLDRTGNLINAMAYSNMLGEKDGTAAAFSYTNFTYDLSGEEAAYFWSVLGLWGGAGLAKPLLFPYSRYTLSPWGKALYAAGVTLDTAGNVLSLISRIAGAGWSSIESALDENPAAAAGDPKRYRTAQLAAGYSAYASWALATAASVAAPYIRGERSVAVSGGLQGILHSAGAVFSAFGNLSSIVAYNARLLVDIRSRSYDRDTFPAGTSSSYDLYETAYSFYSGATIAAYGFWGLGALSSITAVIIPARRIEPADTAKSPTRPEPLWTLTPIITADHMGISIWY